MTTPTLYFDGVKRRIYEVPPGASYITDVNGYRIYDGGTLNAPLMTIDVKKDMWSRWIDWHALNDWALLAFSKSGGAQRPNGSYQTADFTLLTQSGWRFVMANYPHETVFYGNLQSEGSDTLFDISRLTAQGIMPRLVGSDALLTYNTGSSLNEQDKTDISNMVWTHSFVSKLLTVAKFLGLK